MEKFNEVKTHAQQFSDNYSKFLQALQGDNVGGMIDALSNQAVKSIENETITGGSIMKKKSLKKRRKRGGPSRKKKHNKIVINKRKKIRKKKYTRKH